MARVGFLRYLYFRLPSDGVLLTSLTVIFLRDNAVCADGLLLANPSTGLYVLTYTPSAAGFDYLDLYHAASSTRVTNSEQIDDVSSFFFASDVTLLTQDFGGVGRLKSSITSPETYTLMVFPSTDWQAGRTQALYAIASTSLDASGNWLTTPLSVLAGTYHIVLQNGLGSVQVLFPFLAVP